MIFIAVMLASCKVVNHDKELAEINALRTKLNQTDSILKIADREEAERFATELKNNTQFIQFNINKIGDTLDFKSALLLNNYHSLLPAFEAFVADHKQLSAAIDSTKKTLDNLVHDLQNNALSKTLSAETCVLQEKEQVNQMYEFAVTMRSSLTRAKAGYDTLTPKISDYMKSLNQQLANVK